ncbi:MAG: hypothetical protein H0T63_05590, partial [Pyrinomonadaceae bacterium]|nr:hypothetical protein [Pyrinomonadaceae bacterium]
MKRIAVVPGDGIGPEVIEEAVGVLEALCSTHGVDLELMHFDWGADRFLRDGSTLPDGALEMLTEEFDAILAGAFGDPRVPSNKHAEDILLGMRRGRITETRNCGRDRDARGTEHAARRGTDHRRRFRVRTETRAQARDDGRQIKRPTLRRRL